MLQKQKMVAVMFQKSAVLQQGLWAFSR